MRKSYRSLGVKLVGSWEMLRVEGKGGGDRRRSCHCNCEVRFGGISYL